MKSLPPPKPGDPIRAADAAAHLAGTREALNWSLDGADLEAHSGGRGAVVRPRDALVLVEIASAWQWEPPGNDTEAKPTAWHYCTAKLLHRYVWPKEAWHRARPEKTIRLWAPAGYPAINRDAMRGKGGEDQLLPPRYAEGDWCWATYSHVAGLWLLVDGYEQLLPARVKDEENNRLVECGSAKALLIDGGTPEGRQTAIEVDVYDDYGAVANWRYARLDENGCRYAPPGTDLLIRHMAGPNRWVVILLRACPCQSGSEPPSSDSQSGGGGGCPDGTSATLDVLVAAPVRDGNHLVLPTKRLVFSRGCLTGVEQIDPQRIYVCCDEAPPPSSSDGSSDGSSEGGGSGDPDPFDPDQDWVIEDCTTFERVRLHASVGQQWTLGRTVRWQAEGISERCGRLVGNHTFSAVAYDWQIIAEYDDCAACLGGSSSSSDGSSEGSSEGGEYIYVVRDCQTDVQSRIGVPIAAAVGQVIRWRVGTEGVPRCGVVLPAGSSYEESYLFTAELLGLYDDCNTCLN